MVLSVAVAGRRYTYTVCTLSLSLSWPAGTVSGGHRGGHRWGHRGGHRGGHSMGHRSAYRSAYRGAYRGAYPARRLVARPASGGRVAQCGRQRQCVVLERERGPIAMRRARSRPHRRTTARSRAGGRGGSARPPAAHEPARAEQRGG